MNRKNMVLITLIGSAIIFRFFCGIYVHDEFGGKHFFIKHRPTWKWKFYSPVGMSDTKFEELSEEEKIEQKYFNEFVKDKKLSL